MNMNERMTTAAEVVNVCEAFFRPAMDDNRKIYEAELRRMVDLHKTEVSLLRSRVDQLEAKLAAEKPQ